MHTNMTHDGKIALHHNGDWSGNVEIVASSNVRMDSIRTILDTPRRLTLPAKSVLSGDYERPSDCPLTERELRRATALAMWLRTYQESIAAVEQVRKPEGL